jgi:hypothetical protein
VAFEVKRDLGSKKETTKDTANDDADMLLLHDEDQMPQRVKGKRTLGDDVGEAEGDEEQPARLRTAKKQWQKEPQRAFQPGAHGDAKRRGVYTCGIAADGPS